MNDIGHSRTAERRALGKARAVARDLVSNAIGRYVELTWRSYYRHAIPHTLPGRLTVSLTSYPPRYSSLGKTIKSLLSQSMRPDSLMLWIPYEYFAELPRDVSELQEAGALDIRLCENLRSYNKIIHALALPSKHFIVTADDDQYYHRNWLRDLIREYQPGSKQILCGRAHRIRLNDRGVPIAYSSWQFDIEACPRQSLVFPTGGGGVLYEPDIFHRDVMRKEVFLEICPTADDVWLYWMAAMNGATFRKVGARRREVTWPKSQHIALYKTVNRDGNDQQIKNMILRYGFPEPRNLVEA